MGLADFGTGKSHGVFGTKHHPELPLLAPGATVECHGPELLDLLRELERLGLRAVAMTRKRPAHYTVTVGSSATAHKHLLPSK